MAREAKDEDQAETHPVRLSFRSTSPNMDKIVLIAQAKGWFNAVGKPNVSRVLNFLVEIFDADLLKKKDGSNGRRRKE
jgi:hypothetical protein